MREGKAVYDVMHSDRVVIGTESEKARDISKEVYRALYLNEVPFTFDAASYNGSTYVRVYLYH